MTFDDGVYKIINAKSPTSFLTMDTSLARQPTHVFGYPWCNKDTQKWCIKSKKGCGGYTIQNVGTNKYLGISGGASDNHDVFGMSASSSWAIKDVGKGRVRLYIEGTVFNLDLAGYGDPTPGTRVSLWGKNENNVNQCWKLEKVLVTSPPKFKTLTQASIRSGVYMILNIYDNNALDLSQNDYRSIITWPLHGNANQRWHIDQLGEGYSIRSVSSGKYLTAEEGGTVIVANGFPVSWAISNLPGGRELDMYIRWPSQRIAMSLVTPATTSGQNKVEMQGFNWDSKWQGWRLIPVECPSVVSSTISQSRPPTLQNVAVASGGMQALHGTLNTNVTYTPEDRSTTESATVTVSEDDYSVTTTRTTVTTAVVSSVVPK